MELGLTFPLQRFARQKPPCGIEADRRFCWDLHVITLRGQKSLLAVHCHSRYTFVRFGVSAPLWADLPGLFRTGLADSLAAAGLAPAQIAAYLQAAGAVCLTRTHGRREVAFLNRAWEDVLALDTCLDPASAAQPMLDWAVNARPSRCVGFDERAPAAERIRASLAVVPDAERQVDTPDQLAALRAWEAENS